MIARSFFPYYMSRNKINYFWYWWQIILDILQNTKIKPLRRCLLPSKWEHFYFIYFFMSKLAGNYLQLDKTWRNACSVFAYVTVVTRGAKWDEKVIFTSKFNIFKTIWNIKLKCWIRVNEFYLIINKIIKVKLYWIPHFVDFIYFFLFNCGKLVKNNNNM